MYKPISIEEKFKKKTENSVFSGPIVLLFSLKSGPWTGNDYLSLLGEVSMRQKRGSGQKM